MAFVREVRFDRMGAFAFSPEEDTTAALLPDQIDESVKQQRLSRLMALQQGISRELNQQRVGSVCRVLVTGRQQGAYTGRSQWEAPDADGLILFDSVRRLTPGEFVQVRITGAEDYDLRGEAVEGDA